MADPSTAIARSGTTREDSIEGLRRLDALAWQQLFDQYFQRMYSFAYVRTGDVQAAEDIASEVFAAAVKGIKGFRDTGAPIGAWLYRIARGLTADHLESRRRRPSVPLDQIDLESPNWSGRLDEKSDLLRGISALSTDQQDVLMLVFFEGCTVAETATILGKTPGNVRVIQHRALAALRKSMPGEAQR